MHGAFLGPGCSVASLGSIEYLQQRFESSRQTSDLFDWSGHLFSILGNVCRFCGKEASAPDAEVPQRPGALRELASIVRLVEEHQEEEKGNDLPIKVGKQKQRTNCEHGTS